jgi:tetratricopeptide (TPR) repeat protein
MLLGPALTLGLIELVLYLLGYGYPTPFFLADVRPDGAKTFVENPDFGRRFFPRHLVRVPLTLTVPAVKPAQTYRIFVLGESAALGIPNPSAGFARILGVMLGARYPERRFEIINTAMTSINSHVILPIARECARHRPDLFLVFMGNNEVVGPYGTAGVLGPFVPSRCLSQAQLLAKDTRTGQLLDEAIQRLRSASVRDTPRFWRGMEMFNQCRSRADDPRQRAVVAHFGDNFRDICAAAIGSGARVIVCTVPVNLRDCAPFASLHAPHLDPGALRTWERAYSDGIRREAAGQPAEAARCYDEAARIDGQFADMRFRQGRCAAALGRAGEAARHYAQARDLDALRFRTDSTLNETIRRTVRSLPDGVSLLDAERDFAADSPAGIPGEDLFYEHVHMNFHGNYVVARGLLGKIAALLPPPGRPRAEGAADAEAEDDAGPLSEPACAERLAYTARERLADVAQVCEMLQNAPFTNQLDAAERAGRWEKRRRELQAASGPEAEALREALAASRKALAASPDDWMIRLHLAGLLADSGALSEAARLYDAALGQVPRSAMGQYRRAAVWLRMGKLDEADAGFRTALRILPDFAGAHYGRAEVLAARGQVKEAIAVYDARVQADPDRGEVLRQKAGFLERAGKPRSARMCLEEALRLDPDDALVRVDLGNALTRAGALELAITQYEAARRLRPNWSEVAEHLAKLYKIRSGATRQGRDN